MTIKIPCECGKVFQVKDELNGKRVKCPGCGQAIVAAPAREKSIVTEHTKSAEPNNLAKPKKKKRKRQQSADAVMVRRVRLAAVVGILGGIAAIGTAGAIYWNRTHTMKPAGALPTAVADQQQDRLPKKNEPKPVVQLAVAAPAAAPVAPPGPTAYVKRRPVDDAPIAPVLAPGKPKGLDELIVGKEPVPGLEEFSRLEAPIRDVFGKGTDTARIQFIAFSPDGKQVVGAGSNADARWYVEGGLINGHAGKNSYDVAAWSPDGRRYILAGHSGHVEILDTTSGKSVSECDLGRPVKDPDFKPTFRPGMPLPNLRPGQPFSPFGGDQTSVVIQAVALAPDGKHALAATCDANAPSLNNFTYTNFRLRLYEIVRGKEVRRFQIKHKQRITCLAFSPDGRRAISSGQGKTVRVWDVATGKEIRSFSGHESRVNAVALSADGKLAISGSGSFDQVKLKQLLQQRKQGDEALIDSTVRVWDMATGKEIWRWHGPPTTFSCVAISPNSDLVIAGTQYRKESTRLWDLKTGKELCSFTFTDKRGTLASAVDGVAFSPDGRLAALANPSSGVVAVFRLPGKFAVAKREEKKLKPVEIPVIPVANLRELASHNGAVAAVAFLPDGRRAVSAGGDSILIIWDVGSGKEIRRGKLPGPTAYPCIATSYDGRQALVGGGYSVGKDGQTNISSDCDAFLMNLDTGQKVRSLKGHSGPVHCAAISSGGGLAVTGDDAAVRVWESGSGRMLREFTFLNHPADGHKSRITSVAFTPGGKRIASGSDDKTVKLWDFSTGAMLHTFVGHAAGVTCIAFSRDGQYMLSGSDDNTMELWNVPKGKEIRAFEGHVGGVRQIAFVADGHLAISADREANIFLWDVNTGKSVYHWKTEINEMISLAISGDARHIIFGTEDNRVYLGDLNQKEKAQ